MYKVLRNTVIQNMICVIINDNYNIHFERGECIR